MKKKLYLYESLSPEMHGLIEMPIEDIINGVKMMEIPPAELWKTITDINGHQYFLPVIEKNYAHLFVNDIGRH